jgi:hypothetical protein
MRSPHDADAHAPVYARLTNGFSKKLENHMRAISLHFTFYNFCKIYKTLRVTPDYARDGSQDQR